ncbi:MAG: 50S ribosomal protein L7Ae [Candidatus Micrarchaeota archaeon]
MAKEYVKFETPADIQKKVLDLLNDVKVAGGIIRKGTNESTKAVERGEAKLVIIAEDVDPAEIVMHLPQICSEKKVPYVYVKEKAALGKAAGLNVGSAAMAIQKAGNSSAEAVLKDIVSKMAGKLNIKSEEKKPEAKEEQKEKAASAPKKKKTPKKEEAKADVKPEEKAPDAPKAVKMEEKPKEAAAPKEAKTEEKKE